MDAHLGQVALEPIGNRTASLRCLRIAIVPGCCRGSSRTSN